MLVVYLFVNNVHTTNDMCYVVLRKDIYVYGRTYLFI